MEPIPYEVFVERIRFPSRVLSFINHGGVKQIIPLRSMKAIDAIIEMHDKKTVIMDGIHRNFLLRISGTDIWSIVIESVGVAFPTSVRPWKDIVVMDDKPERKEDRFFDLRMHLFRDLNYVGIDG